YLEIRTYKAVVLYTSLAFIVLTLIGHAIAGDPYALPNKTYPINPSHFDDVLVNFYIFAAYNETLDPKISHVNPIYVFLQNPDDNMDNIMQPSIIDLIPGDDGYSDLKRINIVTGLTKRSGNITSYDDLKKLGNSVRIFQSDIYYNLPV
ncbi:27808_t:CDS:2, partial [Racocetra persica]